MEKTKWCRRRNGGEAEMEEMLKEWRGNEIVESEIV